MPERGQGIADAPWHIGHHDQGADALVLPDEQIQHGELFARIEAVSGQLDEARTGQARQFGGTEQHGG